MHVYMCFDHIRWWNILRMQSVHQTDLNSCPTPLMVSSLEQASQKRRKKWPLESSGCNMYSRFGSWRNFTYMLLGSGGARSGNFPEKIGCLRRCHVCALFYYSAPVSSSKSLPAINTHIIARCLHTKMRNIRASSCQGLDHQ